ncbi:MAG TPA: CmpA/NrtA family ABC transporter substrate-binding protein [Verrucomicrobiae bacterium]|jgi:ABC-type nitrate/sulfonate/bicarbonate transport system substrate-binding protein
MNKKPQTIRLAAPRTLRMGFVPLTDCAPIVMADQLGLFKKFGLHVRLSRELGWATVRDKIVHGELDAAHALAAMPLAATLGLGSAPVECLTSLVLNLHGNAITLSNDLWQRGVRDGDSLREAIRAARQEKVFTFGVVFPFSSHRQLLWKWLSAHGIDPERDVRIVVVPPPQMAANLKAGNLDGFCSGEPWNSVAVQSRAGWIAATSAELEPGHPEKVLMVRRDFAERHSTEHLALVAALKEACEFCDHPENRPEIATTLAQPEFVGVPAEILARALGGKLDCGNGITRQVGDFFVFHHDDANEPSGDKAAWALQLVRASGLCTVPSALNFALGRRVFRSDLFQLAAKAISENPTQTAYEKESELIPV